MLKLKRTIITVLCLCCIAAFFSNSSYVAFAAASETDINHTADEYHSPNDYRYMDTFIMRLIETDWLYYYLGGNHIVYCADKEELEWMPLCAKPECRHTDANCNAWVNATAGIGYYNGNIYYIEQKTDTINGEIAPKYYLSSMEEDGSNHKTLREVEYPEMSNCNYMVHRGKLYYIIHNMEENSSKVLAYDLDNPSKEPEIVLEEDGSCFFSNVMIGNYGYFLVSQQENSAWHVYQTEEKQDTIAEGVSDSEYICYDTDTQLYLHDTDKHCIVLFDQENGSRSELLDFSEQIEPETYPTVWTNGKFIFVGDRQDGLVFVWNMEGDYIGKSEISCLQGVQWMVFTSNEKCYFFADDGQYGTWYGFLNMKELQEGQLIFHEL